MTWHRIVLPYAVFGVRILNGRIVEAAPIAKWALGKTENEFFAWVHRKGGSIQVYK